MKLIETLQGKKHTTPPVWMMRQAGRYLPEYRAIRQEVGNFMDMCFTPDVACEITLQPLRRFDFDAAILFSDILVIPHALGVNVRFESGVGPVLDKLTDPQSVAPLFNRIADAVGALSPVYEAVKLIRKDLATDKALIGFCGAPWTVGAYMLDAQPSKSIENLKTWAFKEPQAFDDLMQVLAQTSLLYLQEQIKAGANALQIFDSWASQVPDVLFERAVEKPLLYICRGLKAFAPEIPIIVFLRGVDSQKLKHWSQHYGHLFEGMGLDYSASLADMASCQTRTTLQGNMDPMVLLSNPATVKQEVKRILNAVDSQQRFIFNLGHGITPPTPIENVQAMVEAVRTGA